MYKQSLKVDQLGRITIPITVRRDLGIEEGKSVNVRYDNDKLEILRAGNVDIIESIEDVQRAAKECNNIELEELSLLLIILDKLKAQ